MKEKIMNFLVNKIVARISYWIGRLTGAFSFKAITGEEYEKALMLLEHGDIICTVNRHAWFSNMMQRLLTDAEYFHCGIWNNADDGTVIEATEFGVKESLSFEFFASKDKFIILRPNLFGDIKETQNIRQMAVLYAKQQIGLPYDYAFDFSQSSNDSYYCSELVWKAYKEATEGQSPFELRFRYGVLTATPQDIVDARSKFIPIMVSKGLSYSERLEGKK